MEKILDLSQAAEYDLIVAKDRTLNSSITCTYLNTTGGTELFDFTAYSGAVLTIKNNAGTVLMTFTTSGSSIGLSGNTGVFTLIKSAAEMDTIRAGEYNYDMYLISATIPKRAFLRGKITFIQNIAN